MHPDGVAGRLRHDIDEQAAVVAARTALAERSRLEGEMVCALARTEPAYRGFIHVIDDGTGPAFASLWDFAVLVDEIDWFPTGGAVQRARVHTTVMSVCDAWHVTPQEMRSRLRNRRFIPPRQVLMYLLRENVGLSWPAIGRMLHRDHTTAMSGFAAVERRAAASPFFAARVEQLRMEPARS